MVYSTLRFWMLLGIIAVFGFILSLASVYHNILSVLLLVISLIILLRFCIILVKKRRVSVDLLMGVAGIVTWYIGAVLEGFLVFALYSMSELIEHYAEKYAKRKLVGLRELLPEKVPIQENGEIREKDLDSINVGDVALIRPGDTVPADSIIVDGESAFDTSYITGEPELKVLRKGDYVESGYVNKGGLVRVRILKKPKESLLQLLVMEAEKALARKASIQKFIERFSQPYTILILVLFTLASIVIMPYRALAILLAGCPSAFIISSATSTALAIALLARKSVVVHGGIVLENASKSKVLVLDKTGTVTLGKLKIVRTMVANNLSKDEVLKLAGGAAKASNHPVAKAIAELSDLIPEKAIEYPGKGVKAVVNGKTVLIGSRRFFEEEGVHVSGNLKCEVGGREVLVAINHRFSGIVCLGEEVSKNVREIIFSLKNMGLKLIMASGDVKDRVEKVAKLLSIKEYYASMGPFEKMELIKRLKTTYKNVAMVGDGINDVEALAEANVGIAIGDLSVVSSVADVVMPRGIDKLPELFQISKRYMASLYVSMALALTIKLAVMLAGLVGLLPLWAIVGIGDDGSTLVSLGVVVGLLAFKRG